MADEPKKIEPMALVEALADDGLAEYLLDTDSVNELIKWIHDETGIPKTYLTPAFKILGPLMVKAGQKAATWGAGKVSDRAQKALMHLPFYDLIAGFLTGLKQRLSDKASDKKLLDDIIAGRRPPSAAEYGKGLSSDLQLHLKTLASIDELKEDVLKRLDEVISLSRPQPPLRLTTLDPEADAGRMRLHYQAQRVPFVGRQDEKQQLNEWLGSEAAFSWWIISGSGGQGKSRLALELCRRHGNGWRVGFLPREHKFVDWDGWQPDRPTLMVVDYASGKEEELRSIIAAMHNRSEPFDWPVRFLLIEREASGKWWDDFTSYSGEGGAVIQSTFADPLQLGSMSEDDIWQTILFILEDHGADVPDNKIELVKSLKEIDPELRPLYAAFAAEALALGNDIRGWNKTKLLSLILDRERREFWPKDVTPAEKNLLCLATMLGGMPVEVLGRLKTDVLLPTLDGGPNQFNADRYSAMSGRVVDDTLDPLEPDILGEFFVLEHLTPLPYCKPDLADKMRSLAWDTYPYGFGAFLFRTAPDFVSHRTLRILTEPAEDNARQRLLWSLVAVHLTICYCRSDNLPGAKEVSAHLTDLCRSYPNERGIREQAARAINNLGVYYRDSENLSGVEQVLDFQKRLNESHPNDAKVRELLARAALTLSDLYGKVGDLSGVERMIDLLRMLNKSNPDDSTVRKILGVATFGLGECYRENGNHSGAMQLFEMLTRLIISHPDQTQQRTHLANWAVILIGEFRVAHNITGLEKVFALIKELYKIYGEDGAVREAYVHAALSLMIVYTVVSDDIAGIEEGFADLKKLNESYPEDMRVRDKAVLGACVLLEIYWITNRRDNAVTLVRENTALLTLFDIQPILSEVYDADGVGRIVQLIRALLDGNDWPPAD